MFVVGESYPTATISRYNRALNRVGSRPDDPFHFFN